MATAKDTWTADVKVKGGTVTRWPGNIATDGVTHIASGSANEGILAARYMLPAMHYEAAPLLVRIEDGLIGAGDSVAIVAGKGAEVATDALAATGLDHGVTGLLAKTLGVPIPIVILLALVLAYATLAGAGLAPKLKLFGK